MSLFGLLVRRGVATHASAPRPADAAQARGAPGRAAPARPLLAMRLPSMAVTMLAVSPGVLSRMEVVEPPYIAP